MFLDAEGCCFGRLRLVPHEEKPYAEGIFDVAPIDAAQAERPEVRWLCKRHYKRFSEHQLQIAPNGTLTVKKAEFTLVLDPIEGGGYIARAPAPALKAEWELDDEA
jgi:hypothetical protein